MKREFLYARRQSASRMEAIMVGVSAFAILAAIFAFFRAGGLSSVGFLILGFVAFALSRIFDLLGDLFAAIDSSEERPNPGAADKVKTETGPGGS